MITYVFKHDALTDVGETSTRSGEVSESARLFSLAGVMNDAFFLLEPILLVAGLFSFSIELCRSSPSTSMHQAN